MLHAVVSLEEFVWFAYAEKAHKRPTSFVDVDTIDHGFLCIFASVNPVIVRQQQQQQQQRDYTISSPVVRML